MKRSTKHPVIFALVFLCTMAVVFAACKDDAFINGPFEDPDLVTPLGGIFTTMDGNVSLIIPPEAVTQPVKFEVNECFDEYNCNFLLKMVVIEPFTVFQKPVIMKLRYDGKLANGGSLCDGVNIMVYYWDKQENFINREVEKKMCCKIDPVSKTVNLCISQTGIFAIGLNGNKGLN